MKLYKYDSYEEYKAVQEKTNQNKVTHVFVEEKIVNHISKELKEIDIPINFGICHGTRTGAEQRWFSQALGAKVIGTEIASSATSIPNTIQWDFHEIKDEWINSVDFIYSNSLDHSYDPTMCLDQWMKCIRPGGYCILQWTVWHERNSKSDPFGATLGEYVDMIGVDRLEKITKHSTTVNWKRTGPYCYLLWIKKPLRVR